MFVRFLKQWRLHKVGHDVEIDEEVIAVHHLRERGIIEQCIETAMVEPVAERVTRPRGHPRKVVADGD